MNIDKKSYAIFAVISIVILAYAKFTDIQESKVVTQPEVVVDEKTKVTPVEAENKRTTPISGENARITEEMPVAVTKEALDEMINYINADNKEALARMALRGEFFKVNKNERVAVVDSGFLSSEIEVIATGQRGFVPNEFLVKE